MKEQISLGTWSKERLMGILLEAERMNGPGERIAFLSCHFLNTSYKESTLIGGSATEEVFVINLEMVDCFTLIEYVEAMRGARSFDEFSDQLLSIRYRSGTVAFDQRNHFFTDWTIWNSGRVLDVTEKISAGKSRVVTKRLNEKDDGTVFIPGIVCPIVKMTYIPSESVDATVIEHLNAGDYVGIYSEKAGLDVSHVGILIKEKDGVFLRHASSQKKHRKVIDEDLEVYLKTKPGIVILRPRG